MIYADIRHTIEVQMKKKGEKPKNKTLKDERIPVKISGLVGDGLAKTRRGRTLRLSLPYGEVAVSSTCDIELTCNQDKATLMSGSRQAIKIVDEILEGDIPFMEDFIRRAK